MIHDARCRIQDARFKTHYLTPIEMLFIKVVSCTLVFHFFSIQNQHSKIRNVKVPHPASFISFLASCIFNLLLLRI